MPATYLNITTTDDLDGQATMLSFSVSSQGSPFNFTAIQEPMSPDQWLQNYDIEIENHQITSIVGYFQYPYGEWSWSFGGKNFTFTDFEHHISVFTEGRVTSVPEPATWVMLALGGLALGARRKNARA
jgi:hypothetical protein